MRSIIIIYAKYCYYSFHARNTFHIVMYVCMYVCMYVWMCEFMVNDVEVSYCDVYMCVCMTVGLIPLEEIPSLMRAVGFYPSEDEVVNMINEVSTTLRHTYTCRYL